MGAGALVTEKQFKGADPQVPQAGAGKRNTGNQCLLTAGAWGQIDTSGTYRSKKISKLDH